MKKQMLAFSIAIVVAVSLWANDKHTKHNHNGHSHTAHNASNQGDPLSPLIAGGEAAFTALIEVVAKLESDDSTDWSIVDIPALHSHLVDMSHIMLSTTVVAESITEGTISFSVVAENEAKDSLHRTLQAHGNYIASIRPWDIEVLTNEDGASVQIATDTQTDLEKLKALGFYGFMALDSHHQAHHWQIATGNGGQVHGAH